MGGWSVYIFVHFCSSCTLILLRTECLRFLYLSVWNIYLHSHAWMKFFFRETKFSKDWSHLRKCSEGLNFLQKSCKIHSWKKTWSFSIGKSEREFADFSFQCTPNYIPIASLPNDVLIQDLKWWLCCKNRSKIHLQHMSLIYFSLYGDLSQIASCSTRSWDLTDSQTKVLLFVQNIPANWNTKDPNDF